MNKRQSEIYVEGFLAGKESRKDIFTEFLVAMDNQREQHKKMMLKVNDRDHNIWPVRGK